MSDIKFDGEFVIVEGRWLKSRMWDIMLDAEDRRSNNVGERRALAHDFSDGLTINVASDYPGGVTIYGKVNVPGKLMVGARDVAALLDSLTAANLHARVTALELFEKNTAELLASLYDDVQKFKTLTLRLSDEVQTLKAKVAALEHGHP